MSKVWHYLDRHKTKKPSGQPEAARPAFGLPPSKLRSASTAAALLVALSFALPYVFRKQEPVINGERVTECDRLAAHPSDSQKIAPGIVQDQVDIPRARAACMRAVGAEPNNGRLLYQLGRTFFYDRQLEAGINYFEKSAAAGYAQGQFVLGLILTQGNGTEPDACRAGRLWLSAARQRHLYSKIYFTQNWLDDLFADCNLETTDQEIDGFVSGAEELADTPTQNDDVAQMKKNWVERAR